MNGIEKIISRIDADAAAEAAEIKAASDAKCAALREEYDKRAEAEYAQLAADGKTAADTRYERLCGAARLQAKKDLLEEKQQLIGEAFGKAVDTLAAIPENEYVDLCAKLAAKAAFSGEEEMVFSPADKAARADLICEKANKLLSESGKKAALTVSAETRNIRGGIILTDGKVEMNCSFELLVGGLRNELSGEVARALFE